MKQTRRWKVVLEVTDSPERVKDVPFFGRIVTSKKREEYLSRQEILNNIINDNLSAGLRVKVRSAELERATRSPSGKYTEQRAFNRAVNYAIQGTDADKMCAEFVRSRKKGGGR